jgi:hypothetical protein
VVDDEFGDIAHKEKSFADRVMFWRQDEPAQAAPAAALDGSNSPIDAAAEKERLGRLTGEKPVTIRREGGTRIKLPGL